MSAVFGGFGITILCLFLSSKQDSKVESWLVGSLTIASAFFVICALGWGLESAQLLMANEEKAMDFFQKFHVPHRGMSILFILAVYALFASVGLLGWMKSRRLGMFTSAVALFAAAYGVFILMHFMS